MLVADGGIVIGGPSEQALDEVVSELKATVKISVGEPQIAYRETVQRLGFGDRTYEAEAGGGDFARVRLSVEPASRSEFVSNIAMERAVLRYVPSIGSAVFRCLEAGVCAGFPVTDIRVTLHDLAFHPIDSSSAVVFRATVDAMRQALIDAGSTLLEPVMAVTVTAPEDVSQAIVSDLRRRRCKDLVADRADDGWAMAAAGRMSEIKAAVPLSTMLGYGNTLAALSKARATFEMTFSRFSPVPTSSPDDQFPTSAAMR
ncbi:hypothetical protein [Hansschlegelia sp. KR7-227]|uniref:hypothetical protein n=1 Tax=Hansschlegelia sp. KR7-227 TaxID=3400914 RepID=UPI003C052C19